VNTFNGLLRGRGEVEKVAIFGVKVAVFQEAVQVALNFPNARVPL